MRFDYATSRRFCQPAGTVWRRRLIVGLGAATLAIVSLGTQPTLAGPLLITTDRTVAVDDPLAPLNRIVFALNRGVRRYVAMPFLAASRSVLPHDLRSGVVGMLANLDEPQTVAANVLQGDFGQAGRVARRFLINTFQGWGGAVDVAAARGLPPRHEDLRHVLCHYGLKQGPYVVLPFYGGATLRDQIGNIGGLFGLHFVLGDLHIPYRVATGMGRILDDEVSIAYLRDGAEDSYARVRAREYARSRALCSSRQFVPSDR